MDNVDIDNMTEDEIWEYDSKLLKDFDNDRISFEDYLNEFAKCKEVLKKFPPKVDTRFYLYDDGVMREILYKSAKKTEIY
jgi:hypothetical protein